MPRPHRIILFALLTVSCCVVTPFCAKAEEETQINLEEIQAITARWRASFVNIRVMYDMRSLPPLDKPLLDWSPPADPTSAPQFSQTEWIWADHGLDLFDDRSFYWTPGKNGHTHIDVFNGPHQIAFRASYQSSHEDAEQLKHLNIQPVAGGNPTSSFMRAPMEGLYSPATAEWLPEVLAKRQWELKGVETLLGASCAKISNEDLRRTEILWLDLQHDGLPRRRQATYSTGSKTDFVVDELQQLDGGLWFPKIARIQLQARGDSVQNQVVVVTEAQINLSLDLTRFDPPEPVTGTVVTDGRTGWVHMHGQSSTSQVDPLKQDPHIEAVGPFSSVAPVSGQRVWTFVMICGSVTSLVIGLWLRRKVFRR